MLDEPHRLVTMQRKRSGKSMVVYLNKEMGSPRGMRYAEASLPTNFGIFQCIVYRLHDGHEHVALVKGEVEDRSAVLCRIQSECMTSEVFGSLKCDCKHQLDMAMS